MKHILSIFLIAVVFQISIPAFAQDDDSKKKTKQKTEAAGGNVYSSESDPTKPDPFANNAGGSFTVIKYKESKVHKKLRKGEAHSRLSVPNPKGKPLKHKKKHKFLFFG
jgi:hypothetical protein